MSKRIKLQPKILPDQTLPYPYFVDEKGNIGRQDFWKGTPKKLVGFAKNPVAGDLALSYKRLFTDDVQGAVGLYPVFADKNDRWYTETNVIQSVEIL